MKEKKTSFKNEIRESLIHHALVPCILSILILVSAISVAGIFLVMQQNRRECESFSSWFGGLIEAYCEEGERLSENLSIREFQETSSYRIEQLSDIYRFLNANDRIGEFYLLDADCNRLFSSNRDPMMDDYVQNCIRWNTNRDFTEARHMIFNYEIYDIEGNTSSCLLFWKLWQGKTLSGYCGFALPSDRFETMAMQQEISSILVTNRFDRILINRTGGFDDGMKKVIPQFRNRNGLLSLSGRWYFLRTQQILKDEVKVLAVSDCTEFVHLIAISLLLLALVAVVMTVMIFVSAGSIAEKETDIVYELVEALKQVEHGNLDVRLDIHSNDEFEGIGQSFNMMLGSIRHLLSRHQELARENTLAMVQAMESQFNPHFLFNTLESIRYMIRFEPQSAERMIVNLSRLLRYSIQRGEELASLGEELEFSDKYLQIMYYRYGERLQYQIDRDKSLEDIRMPRMILQPIVENSIKYGYGDQKEEVLSIFIHAEVNETNLEIVVEDDGIGIPPDLLMELRENLGHRQNHSGHIGIYNVHRRLYLLYGKGSGVEMESRVGEGTRVILRMPMIYDEKTQG